MQRKTSFNIYGWCFVVLVASFMPWATSPVGFPFFGAIDAISTGWSGNINFLGIIVPNWVAVITAISLAVVSWLRDSTVEIDSQLTFKLALFGAAHSLFFIGSAWVGGARLGLGSVATFMAFAIVAKMLKPAAAVAPAAPVTASSVTNDPDVS